MVADMGTGAWVGYSVCRQLGYLLKRRRGKYKDRPMPQKSIPKTRGLKSSEFKGKTAVQLLVIAGSVATHFYPEIGISEELAVTIVAGIEGLYTLSRTALKAVLSVSS